MATGPDSTGTREWLVANGLGGYASGAVSGAVTRRYHGLLIAALPAPLGRVLMLSQLSDVVVDADGHEYWLSSREANGDPREDAQTAALQEFRMEAGLPVWRFRAGGAVIEKQVVLPHGQNIVHVTYRVLEAKEPVQLRLRPVLAFRTLESAVEPALGRGLSHHRSGPALRGVGRPRPAGAAHGDRGGRLPDDARRRRSP
nr:glycogen debranching enzyme N-terminal domain-containing protein [Azospirillum sp. INR13]